VPTALALFWCFWQRQPGRVEEAAAWLEDLTGLTAQVEAVSRPRPGTLRLSGVRLSEPERGAPVARCERLEVRRHRNLTAVFVVAPVIEVDRASLLWAAIDRQMRRWQPGWPSLAVQCPALEARSRHGTLRLRSQTDCDLAGIAYQGGLVKAWLALRLAEADTTGHVTLWARRIKNASRPATQFQLEAARAFLPAWLVADVCPALGRLEPQTRLRGKLQAVRTSQGWDARLDGVELVGRGLHRVLAAGLPGLGDVELHARVARAVLRGQRLEVAQGQLSAGRGRVAAAALRRAAAALGLALEPSVAAATEDVPFDELNVGFRLDASGLALVGDCGRPGSGIVLRSLGQPRALLTAQDSARVPARKLVELFPASGSASVPAGPAAEALLPLLPEGLFVVSEERFGPNGTQRR
jgi:hypothetical protein